MKRTVGILTMAMLVAGCATEVPIAKNHPVTYQHKIKSAHHWDVIAKDTAQQVATSLVRHNLGKTAVTVSPSVVSNAPFQAGFKNFLITNLVALEQPVAPQGSEVEIQFETQVVRHNSERQASIPGELTVLAAGVLVARQAVLNWGDNAQKAGVLALAGLADWGKGHAASVTKTEVIVTTSVLHKGQYITRKTDVYYLEDEDGSLFEQMKQWRVVG